MGEIKFTQEEVSIIEKNLNFMVFDWAKHLVSHILTQARNQGVKTVYMNTPKTLDAGSITEGKTSYFYERLPALLGFKKEKATLRGKGSEKLWAYHLDTVQAISTIIGLIKTAKQFKLEELPSTYQGAFINIIGRKPLYDENDVQKVLEILKKKQKKPKVSSKFYYDWTSKEWSGSQRFSERVTENVVLQRITSELQDTLQNNPTLLKFWSYLLSQHQHFGPDVVGFALISKVSSTIWVINEIQTDAINAYMSLRRDVEKNSGKKISEETLKDMLEAQNRSKWINKLEMNPDLKQKLIDDPGLIQVLPDNTQNIESWIETQKKNGQHRDLFQHFQSINFNTRIFRTT